MGWVGYGLLVAPRINIRARVPMATATVNTTRYIIGNSPVLLLREVEITQDYTLSKD